MSNRGAVTIHVHAGNITALRAVVDHDRDDTDTGEAPATIDLVEVSGLDVAAFTAADRNATWYATTSPTCEQESRIFMYADHDLIVARHIDDELVINADQLATDWTRTVLKKWNRVRGIPDPAISAALDTLDSAGYATAAYSPDDLRGLDPRSITEEMLAAGIERIDLVADSRDNTKGASA